MQILAQTVGQPLAYPPGQPLAAVALGATTEPLGDAPWHDGLLGGAWSCPAPDDDDDDSARTGAEIEALLGELIAELEG